MTWHIERLQGCESTQDEALQRARTGAPDRTVVISASMGDGRGQHGRSWHAPEGGVYLSIVLRDIAEPRLVTLALGNAVADVLEVAGAEPGLKWVNDVLIDGRKVAGILVEAESTGNELDFLVAGIGLNGNGHASDWGTPLSETATTLEDALGAEVCIEDLEGYLLEEIGRWMDAVRDGRDGDIVAAWRSRDALRGTRVGFDPDGDFCAKVVGTGAGIADDGALLLDVEGDVQRFDNGTVFRMD